MVEDTPRGSRVRVMAGSHAGTSGPISMVNPGMLLDVGLGPGGSVRLEVPQDYSSFAYVYDGGGVWGGEGRTVCYALGEDALGLGVGMIGGGGGLEGVWVEGHLEAQVVVTCHVVHVQESGRCACATLQRVCQGSLDHPCTCMTCVRKHPTIAPRVTPPHTHTTTSPIRSCVGKPLLTVAAAPFPPLHMLCVQPLCFVCNLCAVCTQVRVRSAAPLCPCTRQLCWAQATT